jgi:hypothetical protein
VVLGRRDDIGFAGARDACEAFVVVNEVSEPTRLHAAKRIQATT